MSVRKAKSEAALKVRCDHCNAAPGKKCTDWRGSAILYAHTSRAKKAEQEKISLTEWVEQPTLNDYSGDIEVLISEFQKLKKEGFTKVHIQAGYFASTVMVN